MKSRTSFCNAAILKKDLLRGAPLWGGYLLLWLLILPLSLLSESYYYADALNMQEMILMAAEAGSSWVPFVYGPLTAFLLFSYQYRSRSANFFGALPVTRDQLFATNYLTGLLYAVIPHVTVAAVTGLVVISVAPALLIDVLAMLLYCLLGYVFYFSFACLCAMMVGHFVAMPLLYLVLNFAVVLVELIIRELLSAFVYGVSFTGNMTFTALSPLIYQAEAGLSCTAVWDTATMPRDVVAYELINTASMWVMLAVGAVFAVLAWLLQRYRRLEAAGDVIAVKRLRPVFLYGFTFGCSVVIGWVLASVLISGFSTSNFFGILFCMVIGATIGYFSGEMMLQKTLRVFRKANWLRLGIACTVVLAGLLVCRFDLFGIAAYVPAPEEIHSAQLGSGSMEVEDPRLIGLITDLHGDLVDSRVETEDALRSAYDSVTVRINYTLKNGSTVSRRYAVPLSEDTASDPNSLVRRYETIYNDPDYIVLRELPGDLSRQNIASGFLTVYTDIGAKERQLTVEETVELLQQAVIPDLRAGRIGAVSFTEGYLAASHDKYEPSGEAVAVTKEFISLELQIMFRDGYSDYLYLEQTATETIRYLTENGYIPADLFEQSDP